jgi:hypothetical protein
LFGHLEEIHTTTFEKRVICLRAGSSSSTSGVELSDHGKNCIFMGKYLKINICMRALRMVYLKHRSVILVFILYG